MQCPQESHTEELVGVMQAKTGPKLVPTVLHFPPPLPHTIPTPPAQRLQLSWNKGQSKTSLETGASHAQPSYTQQLFLHIFQIVGPNVRTLCSLRPAGIHEFEVLVVCHIRTGTL